MSSFITKAFHQLIRAKKNKCSKTNKTATTSPELVHSNRNQEISIIGGADGPTSIFIAKRDNVQYKKRQEEFQLKCKKLKPNAHSFEELVDYMKNTYDARQVFTDEYSYLEEYRNIKSALILRERPDLVSTPMPENPNKEQLVNKSFMLNYMNQIEQRSKEAYEIEDHIFPIVFEQYEILIKKRKTEGRIVINLEHNYKLFSISYQYSKNRKKSKTNPCNKIVRDIYRFYGVTKEDITEQNERCRTYVNMVELK